MTNVRSWGATADERALALPCDDAVPDPDEVLWRAVTVATTPERLWPWIRQLQLAPYSYDLVDNGGRRSPRTLIAGLPELAPGTMFQRVLRVVDVDPPSHVTAALGAGPNSFVDALAVTYAVLPVGATDCRLVAKMLLRYGATPWKRAATKAVLPGGDLLMMRKQLRTLAALAVRGG